ncbi:MAG TPA: hypothetical protein VFO68_06310, partial [Actinophytocola sp.]|nr:hypothetical protein [Actinophytocola sp.]
PLTRTAVVAGADGVIVDVHPQPDTALCDGPQALIGEDLPELARTFRELAAYMGRDLTGRGHLRSA